MGVPHGGLHRNAACSLAILAVIATISLGLPALDRAFPGERAVASGVVYAVTDGVTVVPPAGARLDVSQTRPGRDSGYAMFLVGRVRFAILVTPDRITTAAAADRLRTRLRDGLGASTTGAESPTPSGALTGRFHAGADGGWYAVRVLGSTTVVDATASGPPDELARWLPAIEAAAASIARAA
ncbi:hypothetical protein [Planosporangium mesophilum]|uniref:Uncharacterized protein n=1 Tax=Planosporangium mesophilum TaxID=689768 RepID=A0A8J3X1X3_9ACTN|nr:hypothetical protein [Planosporangium mesophilum]NJC82365.1 hypothetical protein [Planosporangium mesophilum]GII24892.1 hypothetical protein Pme01_44890 [Planosporangium mesophilum]